MIDYQPVSDDPLLSWLNTRVPAKDVQIDMEMYRFRKNRHWERIKTMEAYVKLPVCRRNFILYYFGEKPEGVCGQCDVCKRTTRSTFDNELFEDVYFRLEDCLGPGGAVMDEVKEKCKDLDEDEVLRVLEYLQNEEFIVQDREMLMWNRETT